MDPQSSVPLREKTLSLSFAAGLSGRSPEILWIGLNDDAARLHGLDPRIEASDAYLFHFKTSTRVGGAGRLFEIGDEHRSRLRDLSRTRGAAFYVLPDIGLQRDLSGDFLERIWLLDVVDVPSGGGKVQVFLNPPVVSWRDVTVPVQQATTFDIRRPSPLAFAQFAHRLTEAAQRAEPRRGWPFGYGGRWAAAVRSERSR
jgi:hypothetical protein